ncbi:hypothetical protein QR98_0041710 [Sarcoptes scabiei]|uniref:Uncharacterized protein n=1 Tax=Sarcoptes scabiei TaxID=52283 RepID=A0A132A3Z2_SARSC|nr:hypothetical protein QR98_0041710 [Sarcoptes scabiei]
MTSIAKSDETIVSLSTTKLSSPEPITLAAKQSTNSLRSETKQDDEDDQIDDDNHHEHQDENEHRDSNDSRSESDENLIDSKSKSPIDRNNEDDDNNDNPVDDDTEEEDQEEANENLIDNDVSNIKSIKKISNKKVLNSSESDLPNRNPSSKSTTITNTTDSNNKVQPKTPTLKRDRDNYSDDDHVDQNNCAVGDDRSSNHAIDESKPKMASIRNKSSTSISDNLSGLSKKLKLDSLQTKSSNQNKEKSSSSVSDESNLCEVSAQFSLNNHQSQQNIQNDELNDSVHDVAELARLRAAKFIQERTKMACLLPTSTSGNPLENINNRSSTTQSSVHSASGQHSSTRKRKLTVKDILVSQRNRNSEANQQQMKRMTINAHHNNPIIPPTSPSPLASNNNPLIGLTNQMFGPSAAALCQILDPNLQSSENANPLTAILAAAAAASAPNNTAPNNAQGNGSLIQEIVNPQPTYHRSPLLYQRIRILQQLLH